MAGQERTLGMVSVSGLSALIPFALTDHAELRWIGVFVVWFSAGRPRSGLLSGFSGTACSPERDVRVSVDQRTTLSRRHLAEW